MIDVERPKLEGNVAVGDNRRIGIAEFGSATGRAVFWLHGTPGARRQIPIEARRYAESENIRIIGLDRPGVGSSTPHSYDSVHSFADDLSTIADTLGIDRFAVIGLSGGGPYALAVAEAMPQRVVVTGILGGVAPTHGPEAIDGGAMEIGKRLAPLLPTLGMPIGRVLSSFVRVARPIAEPAIGIYGRFSPAADRELLQRPEFKAMFLDDLLNGGRKQMEAPFADVVVFCRDWGFKVGNITGPVRWWHGDHDHIIPHAHGEHMVQLLADAKLLTMTGESHLGGLGMAVDIIAELMDVWDQQSRILIP
ncbi:alpha/beta hydrolase [Williamsia sp.]|uniref:alpha/beta fold hydrolase n=1 Tax=Williamsia sp. TaxID=1872085 RepID=UPI002F937D29